MAKRRYIACLLALALCLFGVCARAQDVALCGPPPALPTTSQSEETLKGQLQGQADLLSKLIGKAELAGQVEAVKKQIYQDSDKFFAAQKDAYLAYLFCLIVMQDKTSDLSKRLDALQVFQGVRPLPPHSALPITMTQLASETQPLDGYQFIHTPTLPTGLPAGTVLPGGGRTRLLFQATNSDQITEIDRIKLITDRHDIASQGNLAYNVDPSRLPGFGAARPHRFNIRMTKSKVEVSYLNDNNTASPVRTDNLLEGTTFPLLRLDRTAGLQETLDFAFLAADPGLYEIHIVAHVTSDGKEYELQTNPFYIVGR